MDHSKIIIIQCILEVPNYNGCLKCLWLKEKANEKNDSVAGYSEKMRNHSIG